MVLYPIVLNKFGAVNKASTAYISVMDAQEDYISIHVPKWQNIPSENGYFENGLINVVDLTEGDYDRTDPESKPVKITLKQIHVICFYCDSISGGEDVSGIGSLENPFHNLQTALKSIEYVIRKTCDTDIYFALRVKGIVDYPINGHSYWELDLKNRLIIMPYPDEENVIFKYTDELYTGAFIRGFEKVYFQNCSFECNASQSTIIDEVHWTTFDNCEFKFSRLQLSDKAQFMVRGQGNRYYKCFFANTKRPPSRITNPINALGTEYKYLNPQRTIVCDCVFKCIAASHTYKGVFQDCNVSFYCKSISCYDSLLDSCMFTKYDYENNYEAAYSQIYLDLKGDSVLTRCSMNAKSYTTQIAVQFAYSDVYDFELSYISQNQPALAPIRIYSSTVNLLKANLNETDYDDSAFSSDYYAIVTDNSVIENANIRLSCHIHRPKAESELTYYAIGVVGVSMTTQSTLRNVRFHGSIKAPSAYTRYCCLVKYISDGKVINSHANSFCSGEMCKNPYYANIVHCDK